MLKYLKCKNVFAIINKVENVFCGFLLFVKKLLNDFYLLIARSQKMDKNKDGVVTLEEFVLACQEVRSHYLQFH